MILGLVCSLLSYLMSFNITCLLQGRFSQPKDDSWSDCAKKGYAGIRIIMLSHNPRFCFLTFVRIILDPSVQIPLKISEGKNRGETVTFNGLNIWKSQVALGITGKRNGIKRNMRIWSVVEGKGIEKWWKEF